MCSSHTACRVTYGIQLRNLGMHAIRLLHRPPFVGPDLLVKTVSALGPVSTLQGHHRSTRHPLGPPLELRLQGRQPRSPRFQPRAGRQAREAVVSVNINSARIINDGHLAQTEKCAEGFLRICGWAHEHFSLQRTRLHPYIRHDDGDVERISTSIC